MDELRQRLETQWAAVEASGDPRAAIRFVSDTYPTLLAALAAVTAERNRYRAALVALVGDEAPSTTTPAGRYCVYCYAGNHHTAGCAWVLARALLTPGAGGTAAGVG